MLNLLGTEDPMIIFTELFMCTLPAEVRMPLAMPQRSPDLLAPAAAPPPDHRKRVKDDARPSGQQGDAVGYYFYHATFGAKAKRCRSP